MRAIAVVFCLLFASIGAYGQECIKPIASVEEGIRLVQSFRGKPQDFELAVPESLLDSTGLNIAIITDAALKRGWMPDGFTQRPGCRVFRYQELKL